jgi:hypothetical protein
MEPSDKTPRLVFPEGFTDRDAREMERKGFVYAFLECEDGRRYPVMFIDPVRLAQEIEATLQSGQPYYYEFGPIVVPEVTIPALTQIIPHLVEDGCLERHLPEHETAVNRSGVVPIRNGAAIPAAMDQRKTRMNVIEEIIEATLDSNGQLRLAHQPRPASERHVPPAAAPGLAPPRCCRHQDRFSLVVEAKPLLFFR